MACQVPKASKESGAAGVPAEPRESWEPKETRVFMEHQELWVPQGCGARWAHWASPDPAGQQDPGDLRERKGRWVQWD